MKWKELIQEARVGDIVIYTVKHGWYKRLVALLTRHKLNTIGYAIVLSTDELSNFLKLKPFKLYKLKKPYTKKEADKAVAYLFGASMVGHSWVDCILHTINSVRPGTFENGVKFDEDCLSKNRYYKLVTV